MDRKEDHADTIFHPCKLRTEIYVLKVIAPFDIKSPVKNFHGRAKGRGASHQGPPPKYATGQCIVMIEFYVRKQLLLSAHLSHRNSVCLSVRLSRRWISQKWCQLESPNLHRRLPGRL